MAYKFIEITLGQNLPPTRLEIVEVEKDNLTLKNKNAHVELLVTLEKRLKSNYPKG
jgi:hypothetical protein